MYEKKGHATGILLMVISVGGFAVMHAAMKSLTPHYPPLELAALRGLISLPLVAAWAALAGEWGRTVQVRWSLQALRGLFVLITGVMAIFALRSLPLADAYAISFAAPLFIALLSRPFLGEQVDLPRWLALTLGFLGVLVVLRPSVSAMLTLGGLAMLVSAVGYALAFLATRSLAKTDATTSTVLWTTIIVSIGAGGMAAPGWLSIHSEHWSRLALIGALGAFGQLTLTAALRRARASAIAPFEYTALAWSLALDWLLWGTVPTPLMLSGTALIVASGLYLLNRERGVSSRPPLLDTASSNK